MHRVMNTGTVADVDSISRDAADNKYHCPTCNAAFTRRSNLRRHYAIHTRLLGFKCEACNKAFARRLDSDQLRFHLQHCPMRPISASDPMAAPDQWDPSLSHPEFMSAHVGGHPGVPSSTGTRKSSPSSSSGHSVGASPRMQHKHQPHRSHSLDMGAPSPYSQLQPVSNDEMNAFLDMFGPAVAGAPSTPMLSQGSPTIPFYNHSLGFQDLNAPTPDSAASFGAHGYDDWGRPRSNTASSLYSTDSDTSSTVFDTPASPYTYPTIPVRPALRRHSTGSSMKYEPNAHQPTSAPTLPPADQDVKPLAPKYKDTPLYSSRQVEDMLGAMSNNLVGTIETALQRSHPHDTPYGAADDGDFSYLAAQDIPLQLDALSSAFLEPHPPARA